MGEDAVNLISAIVPGVMGQTGMETVEIIKGIVKETKPDIIIAIDALAARSSRRLNRTIQIADTGINPGSGVGNHRNAITKETVGVPVIAIGVPTVVDAATIVNDTMENLIACLLYTSGREYGRAGEKAMAQEEGIRHAGSRAGTDAIRIHRVGCGYGRQDRRGSEGQGKLVVSESYAG